ncbi:MAG: TetR/AcrR family transcriptional regulator [Mycobacteriales bacterium]
MARPPGPSGRYEDRREEIIDRAAQLFAAKGYAATGVNELGEAVGLGRGALYHYIQSKEHLLVAIQDRVLGPLLAEANRIIAIDAQPVVRLRLLSEALLTLIVTRTDHIRVYEHDYPQLTGANLKRVLDQRHQFEGLVQGLLEEAIADGTLRDMDARLASLQFLNLHNHTYTWARTASRHWTVQELSREYCSTLLHGMARDGSALEGLEKAVEHQKGLTAASATPRS